MNTTSGTNTAVSSLAGIEFDRPRLRPVTFNAYSDIHKAIRAELFAVTTSAGRTDVSDELDVAALTGHVASVSQLLTEHAEHEDTHVQPVIIAHLPNIAELIEYDHGRFESRFAQIHAVASELCARPVVARREMAHEMYVELALFTSAYLAHQDLEERMVMPALEDAIGVDAVVGIHMAIVGTMAPDELMRGLATMLPVLNIDDQTGMLGGIRATAPTDAFEGIWNLTRSVLPATEVLRLAARLGISA
ncbi:MAG: hypothetical protein ACKVWR_08505 [Acidimicrobiales bacterium]